MRRGSPPSASFGAKRPCVDSRYFETFNLDNVELVDVRTDAIEAVTPSGIKTTTGDHELDVIVFATGFDAMTGSLLKPEIRGRDGVLLRDRWASGPQTYLGLATSGFPNMFVLAGPGSPSVLTNVIVSIEQHVDWMGDLLAHMRDHGLRTAEAEPAAERGWVAHAGPAAVKDWLAYLDPHMPEEDVLRYMEMVATVRRRGWSIALTGRSHIAFELALAQLSVRAPTEGQRQAVREAAVSLGHGSHEPPELLPRTPYRVRNISAPVFDESGDVVLMLTFIGLPKVLELSDIERHRDRLLAATDHVTRALGGRRPHATYD